MRGTAKPCSFLSRITKRIRSSITDRSFRGIPFPPSSGGKSVTYVSGTFCYYVSERSLEGCQQIRKPIGPSGPVAIPAPHRFPAAGPLPGVSRGLPAALPRSSPRGLARQSSSRAGPSTPASPNSALPESAGHSWKRAYSPARNILACFRT